MNHILVIIGFFLLLYYLTDVKENFSQLFLPNFTNTIYTGKYYQDNIKVVKENKNRKPSPIEDIEQPPYARFVKGSGGSGNISESPEDIRQIKNDLERVNEELNILADTDITISNSSFNNRAICGESNKKLSPANFKTPWRKENENDKTINKFDNATKDMIHRKSNTYWKKINGTIQKIVF